MKNVLFTKIRNVKTPERANIDDAGIDLFIPEFDENFRNEFMELNSSTNYAFIRSESSENKMNIIIRPHCGIKIPSGIRVNILDSDSALIIQNKSGIAANKQLIHGANVIDAGYTGEIIVNVINTSDIDQVLVTGNKVTQMVYVPIYRPAYIEISNEEYENSLITKSSSRGNNGFGSTGN